MAGALVAEHGLGRVIEDAAGQRAGRIGLFNTGAELLNVELASITAGRALGLASYNDYRAHCRFPRAVRFDQVTADPRVLAALRERYRDVNDLELYVGLFAEQPASPSTILPPLLTKIIAIDAFSQALTNPLPAPRVYGEATFSQAGMEIITTTRNLSDILHRNVPEDPGRRFVSMTRRALLGDRPRA